MFKNSIQMVNGKSFEYALLLEFFEKLSIFTKVTICENTAFLTAKNCFDSFSKQEQGKYLLSASFAVNFLMDIEPRLSHGINDKDILQLEILTDAHGQEGDVRDVIAIRILQKWEIGISAKNNHIAVKHSRLSNQINFGQKWLGVNCSQNYFDEVTPIFNLLESYRKESNGTKTWNSLGEDFKAKSIYVPILTAFKNELLNLYYLNPEKTAKRLIEYLVGTKDYYKVIRHEDSIIIQAFNLYGTLNLPFENIFPKLKTPLILLPTMISDVKFKENSSTTIIVTMDNDWCLSFRIHNASTLIEASLKFDIQLLNAPHSIFTNKLLIQSIGEQ